MVESAATRKLDNQFRRCAGFPTMLSHTILGHRERCVVAAFPMQLERKLPRVQRDDDLLKVSPPDSLACLRRCGWMIPQARIAGGWFSRNVRRSLSRRAASASRSFHRRSRSLAIRRFSASTASYCLERRVSGSAASCCAPSQAHSSKRTYRQRALKWRATGTRPGLKTAAFDSAVACPLLSNQPVAPKDSFP